MPTEQATGVRQVSTLSASQKFSPTEQATTVRQASTLPASQRCMPTERDPAVGQAPALSVKGRGELIASIVETGLQIANRMGDRAAAAALSPTKAAAAVSCPSTPAGRQPDLSNHALPAPSILAEQPDIVDEAKEQAVLANTPAKAAAQSPAVSEHEPSQPDETLVVAVPKCQGVLSAAQRERLRHWTFVDGHTTVRERARRREPRPRRKQAPRRSTKRQAAAQAARLSQVTEPEGPSQHAKPGGRKRKAVQPSTRVLRSRKVLSTTSSSDMHQQSLQEPSVGDTSKCKASDIKQGPQISSSSEGDCPGESSAPQRRGSFALQRLASIALKM
ncbi:g8255 [Coccomyxa viridis]|uniref:G8255 protein n=1 Tax=Coccomyxa viridis TaxID=1274662 RepID=A0ABP1G6M9_9CHLO